MKLKLQELNTEPPYMKKFLTTAFFGWIIVYGYTQAKADPRIYYNNMVDLGDHDFGLIVGENTEAIYFIAVRNLAKSDVITSEIPQVMFYGRDLKAVALRVENFKFGEFTVVLYKLNKPKNFLWQKNYFFGLHPHEGTFNTFIDNGLRDGIWSINSGTITFNESLGKGVSYLRVPPNSDIDKGMPVISSEGYIAAIIAESAEGNQTMVKAIDMSVIANRMYIESHCDFFRMVEYGQRYDRCETRERQKQAELKGKKAEGKHSKRRLIDYGINGNIVFGKFSGKEPLSGKDQSNTIVYNVGISLHLNIDPQGYNRLTLKPRYGKFSEESRGGYSPTSNNQYRLAGSDYDYIAMPIIYEREFYRSKDFSTSICFGYSPGIVINQHFVLNSTTNSSSGTRQFNNTGKILIHHVLGELYFFENKNLRLGVIYIKELSSYPNREYKPINGYVNYQPFLDRKKGWYIGVEAAIRFRGNWGLSIK